MGREELFKEALLDSIENKDHLWDGRDNYYDSKYSLKIKDYFDNVIKQISNELNYNKQSKTIPICAFASSGRLCYLYFSRKEGFVLEKPIENDIPGSAPTKMDAYGNNVYYECKCHEIISQNHGNGLSISYREKSNIFKKFNIQHFLKDKKVEITDSKTNEKKISHFLQFNLSELDIHLKKDRLYTKTFFDIKQFICHLIAIANNGGNATLKYIFFVPHNIDKLKTIYDTLKEEMKAIKASSKIQNFCKEYNIKLDLDSESSFVDISTIKDFNYLETY